MKLYSYILILALVLIGCKAEKTPKLPEVDHTLIIYMVAENNLNPYAIQNINDLEAGFNESYGGRVLLFYNTLGGGSQLLEIVSDNTSAIASRVVKSYPEKPDPCLPSTLEGVISECRAYSDSERYSLLLWSHATGWLPQGMSPAKTQEDPQRTFGSTDSHSTQMEIYDLASALPDDLLFEYIYFDACHMGSIEAAYELRSKAKYLVGSAAEVLGQGYPYKAGIAPLVAGDGVGVAKAFYEYYNSLSGAWQSATISTVDLSKLDAVAAELKLLSATSSATPTAEQQFGRYLGRTSDFRDLMWDAEDMATRTFGAAAAPFIEALNNAVVYKAATPILFNGDGNGSITVNTFCGLSIYIPLLSEPQTLEIYRDNYQWAKDTEFYNLAQ